MTKCDTASSNATDPRDAFDAASIPFMREKLATLYSEFREAEAAANRERAPPEAGGRIGAYRSRACPSCTTASEAASQIVSAHGLRVVECPACGFFYARNVMEEGSDFARYRLSDIDQATVKLRDSVPYLHLEVARARYYLTLISEVGGTSAIRRPGSLLEIGCGSGTFLVEASRLGWDSLGVDPGLAAVGQARQRSARVVLGYFPQDLPDPSIRVDLIAMLDVLEHVVEPRPFLREIKERLRPGSLLFVQVPNWDSLLVQVEGARSTIVAPGHWSYFTRDTLVRLMANEGFAALHVETVVSELDRVAGYPIDTIAAAYARLRPGIALPQPLTASDLYRLDLGYKLIGIFKGQ